ncbi:LPS assembly lipoprotein LptE [Parvibaculum sp.]|uniref:LPS assembly lipoprotein LptE n=1 Tax=Parvibaculum sp. TaxID=2024848 RepID=UPI00273095ED|nr:LPS assembly lipoprotein LptE [Parvibaculum sp.]MDP1625951.1 LPS assembly lipoprotein LptE [Parvibaculum sp.]MDP2149656.1 LPS assembly lipoprotein LptE [Parvibaculum sp.]MDP3329602.1 LPS assembly lipoprotein LptE [Parvibaculum sp.]
MFDGSRARLAALLLALPLMALPLAGCGFTPLYADRTSGSVASDLSMLDVSAPETRLGRELKYNLLDLLSSSGNPPANPAYRVVLAPTSYERDVAVEADADVTRKTLVVIVPFQLIDTGTNKAVLSSTSRSRSSYNRVTSEFANITAAEDTESRIAEMLAQDIKLQLSIYFDRQAKAGG